MKRRELSGLTRAVSRSSRSISGVCGAGTTLIIAPRRDQLAATELRRLSFMTLPPKLLRIAVPFRSCRLRWGDALAGNGQPSSRDTFERTPGLRASPPCDPDVRGLQDDVR